MSSWLKLHRSIKRRLFLSCGVNFKCKIKEGIYLCITLATIIHQHVQPPNLFIYLWLSICLLVPHVTIPYFLESAAPFNCWTLHPSDKTRNTPKITRYSRSIKGGCNLQTEAGCTLTGWRLMIKNPVATGIALASYSRDSVELCTASFCQNKKTPFCCYFWYSPSLWWPLCLARNHLSPLSSCKKEPQKAASMAMQPCRGTYTHVQQHTCGWQKKKKFNGITLITIF